MRIDPLASLDLTGLSARNLAILRQGVRGGATDSAPTLDELLDGAAPDKAKDLTDEDLTTLHDRLQAEGVALLEDTANVSDEDIANATKIDAALAGLETIQGERAAAAEKRTADATALLDKIRGQAEGDDGETDAGDKSDEGADDKGDGDKADEGAGDGAGDEGAGDGADENAGADDGAGDATNAGEVEDTTEKIAASKVTRLRPRSAAFAPRKRETGPRADELVLKASSNVPGLAAGELLDTQQKRSMAFCSAVKAAMGHRGARMEIPIMSVGAFDAEELYGPDRYLDDNARGNERKIEKLTSYSALKASGGKCAPSPVRYDFPIVGSTARPVRDALARFGADRGGVRLIPPPTLASMSGGTDVWTNANDTTPSSPATKPCLTMTCPSDTETLVEAITQCLKIGNFRAKYFGEQVDAWIAKSAQWTARFAERRLLTTMGGLMKNVTVGTQLGTTRTVLAGLDRASAGLRNQLRLDPDFPLRFIGPAWLQDNMIADLSREQPGAATERLATSDAEISSFFTAKSINPSWALDGESGQEFAAQNDGALNGWPSHAIGYLYIEGEFLHLDGGDLNLGVVRDSTLVGTNDAIMFSEFMENVAFHGNMAYRIDFDICPDGTTSLPVAITPCTISS